MFFILAINVVGLMALLMQGCRQEKPAPETEMATNAPADTNAAATVPDTNPPSAASNATPVVAEPAPPPAPPVPARPGGCRLHRCLRRHAGRYRQKIHVSLKALEEANPGVEPTKLKIGQKLHLPAPATAARSAGRRFGC